MKKHAFALSALCLAIASGCTVVDKSYDTTRDNIREVQGSIDLNSKMQRSAIEETDALWLGGESFKVSQASLLPSVLKKEVSFRQLDPISVSDLVTMLSIDLGIQIILSEDAVEYTSAAIDTEDNDGGAPNPAELLGGDSSVLESSVFQDMNGSGALGSDLRFTLDYKGQVSGLLDVIASKTGLFWRYERGEIVFKRNETKTYVIDVLPGKIEYTASMKSDLASASGGEGSNHEVKTEFKPKDSWVSLKEVIQSILSQNGRVAFNETVGSVTITDTPQVQSKIDEYVRSFNAIAGRQIAIQAEVFEITSDENGDFDTNIMAMYDWKGDLNIGLNGDSLSFGIGSNDSALDNRFSTGEATAKMLRENKNASLVTSSVLYAMNGNPTPFQQMDEISYLAEVNVTQAERSEPQMSRTPGQTSQGYSMMIMPRIMSDGRVMMNFAVDSSRINSIDEFGDDTNGFIQLPNRSTNKYQQVVSVRSGQALMIAGMERTENIASIKSKMGRASWMLGGSQTGGKRKIMTMIVLTPRIMAK